MKVFVAGATGALGKQLVPKLVGSGHDVWGTTRSESRAALVSDLGARPVVLDALDADAVGEAVSAVQPDVIVHQLTALSGALDLRRFERTFAQTNRLRTEGTEHLLAAAEVALQGNDPARYDEAVALWQEPVLPELYSPRLNAARAHAEERRRALRR